MTTGVYFIRSPSGKEYIGSSKSIEGRWRGHRYALTRGCHVNSALQNAWNKYGIEGLQFGILIICEERNVLLYEQIAIDCFSPVYNVLKIAGRSCGYKHSAETRAKFTAQRTGITRGPMAETTKKKIRDAQVGKPRKPLTGEHRRRLSVFNTERMAEPSNREYLSRINTGKILTDDHKANIGAANKGRRPSREAIEKSIAARVGKPQTEERKARRLASYLRTVALRNAV